MRKLRICAIVLAGGALAACGAGAPTPPSADAIGSASAAPATSTSSAHEVDGVIKTLGTFTDRHGFVRKYVLVKAGMDDAQLVALAQHLHRRESSVRFWLMDDDSHAQQLLQTLPRTEQGDNSGYPLQYVKQHTVAHVQLMLGGGEGRQWVLARGASMADIIAKL